MKKKQTVSYYWEAKDGEVFNNEKDCIDYEAAMELALLLDYMYAEIIDLRKFSQYRKRIGASESMLEWERKDIDKMIRWFKRVKNEKK